MLASTIKTAYDNIFYFINNGNILVFCDAPQKFQKSFQDPASASVEWLLNLHDIIMIDLWIILGIIFFLFYKILTKKKVPYKYVELFTKEAIAKFYAKGKLVFRRPKENIANLSFSHCEYLEIFWTITPAIILLLIALPTFKLLYALNDQPDSSFFLKVTGHQWYWSYEIICNNDPESAIAFDSYIIDSKQLKLGQIRLLEVDNIVVLPTNKHITLSITSADVLHSWAVPSFGIKIDACPGRISTSSLFVKRPGLFFGQCSEICGVNHGFMPIVAQAKILF